MKLRAKILAILIGSTIFIGVVFYLLISKILIGEFLALENDNLTKHLERVVEAIKSEEQRIRTVVGDYSAWNDTYAFMEDRNKDYLKINFESGSFTNLKFNLVTLVNPENEILYKKHFEWRTEENLTFPETFLIEATKTGLQTHANIDSIKGGFLKLPEGIFLLVSHPIVTSDFEGPIRGSMIAGIHLEQGFIDQLSEVTKLKVSWEKNLDPYQFSNLIRENGLTVLGGEGIIQPLNSDITYGYLQLKDINGKPIAVLRIDVPRNTFKAGLTSLNYLLYALIVVAFFVSSGFLLLIDYFIIRRLLVLSDAVNSIQSDFSQLPDFQVGGRDEIHSLASVVKSTFQRLLEARKELQESKHRIALEKEKLDAILHSIGDGIIVLDKNKKIVLVNQVTSRISGFNEKELIGTVYNENLKFVLEKNDQENTKFIDQVYEKKKIVSLVEHTMLVNKKGKKVYVADSAAPIFDHKKQMVGCIVVFRDATKERLIEKAKSEFVSVASHQLRTPLTAIKWILELLLKGKAGQLTKTQLSYLQDIDQSNQRMIDLVTDMLNIARIEYNETYVVQKVPTDFYHLILKLIDENKVLAAKSRITIALDKKFPKKLMIKLDAEKIYQVLMNLISNSIKYSNPGDSVKISCQKTSRQVRISISDRGIGIPEDQQQRIFEKFFRAENAVNKDSVGTGLGLYAVKAIVEAHNGKVSFTSALNQGTTFVITLPL